MRVLATAWGHQDRLADGGGCIEPPHAQMVCEGQLSPSIQPALPLPVVQGWLLACAVLSKNTATAGRRKAACSL